MIIPAWCLSRLLQVKTKIDETVLPLLTSNYLHRRGWLLQVKMNKTMY